MPIIVPGDKALGGFDLSAPIVMPKLFGPVWGGNGGVQSWAKDAWAAANYDQWSMLTGHVMGSIGVTTGIPDWNLPGFVQFFSKMPTVTPSDVASLTLGVAAKAVSIGLAQAGTAIPILGWVVQLGIGIFELVQEGKSVV